MLSVVLGVYDTKMNDSIPKERNDFISANVANKGHPLENDDIPSAMESSEDVCKFIVKAPRPDSKIILQNMEEVLNSVKKKHRQKHKRKREQRKLAQMEAAAVAVATAEILDSEEREEETAFKDAQSIDNETRKNIKSENYETLGSQRLKTKPLQEKKGQENSQENSKRIGRVKQASDKMSPLKKSTVSDNKSPLKGGTSANGNILRHFVRTPKKDQLSMEQEKITEINMNKCSNSPAVDQPKAMNAFEVMMNARNKTIGSNTPGKEISPTTSQESTVNTKRRLMLQEWADKMGGTKRKLEEEKREAYIVDQLDNRAKRFKQMLEHGGSPKQADNSTPGKQRKPRNSNATKQNIDKPKRRKRTAIRLDSIDSIDDNEEITKVDDVETAEFLSKLNSPTKKRDSLLGYFPRKESPTELAVKNAKELLLKKPEDCKSETPKNRTRRSRKNSIGINIVPSTNIATPVREEDNSQSVTGTEDAPSSRPRRSCAGKARYDYDLEASPTKAMSHKKSISKVKNDETKIELEIINLDDSNMSFSPDKMAKKLAPVFVRAVPKPSPDPVILKARQDFLMSGVPEKMRLEMEKQKQYEQAYEEELDHFPRICHVSQLSLNDETFLQNKRNFTLKLRPLEDDVDFSTNYDSPRIKQTKCEKRKSRNSIGSTKKLSTILSVNLQPKKFVQPAMPLLSTVDNKRDIIKLWKGDFERFPTFKCYNQMREKYRFFSALDSAQDMEQVSESFFVTRRTQRKRNLERSVSSTEQDDVKPPATAPNGELLFTEKYKPMLVEQVLVNLVPVTQLRDFLATWANGNGGSARNSQTLDDSCDASNDSSCSLSNATGNAVVLLGPVSSGKTNAVYALANDMNFNVLEINAGMKRTGKRLIQELQEATQSHQIRKDAKLTQSASNVQKNLLRISLNGKKLMKQNSQTHIEGDSNGTGNGETAQNTRKCLILIEDADVVFDQFDSGFTDAIYTLAASSKRPVIVMATNPNCPHLQRLMNQNTIYFTPPNVLNISRFMAVLSLIENCPINLDDLVSLYLYNNKDLRRTLLELQFFIQSGGDRKSITENDIKCQSQKRTPQKDMGELGFFASPTKRRLSDEVNSGQPQGPDEQLRKDRLNADDNTKRSTTNEVYMHRSLFEFFTLNQNEKWRIPFPVDFSLLRGNLADMFHCSQRLLAASATETDLKIDVNHGVEKIDAPKRRTRTAKVPTNVVVVNELKKSSLQVIADFYENVSIAALLGTHNADMSDSCTNSAVGYRVSRRSADLGVDRLQPHMSEHIAHELVEQAICVNLAVDACPYNLFDTPTERRSLCDYMNSNAISARSQRTRALDLEPALRAICRSEKQRAMQERRSTRFYHYLRHSATNVSALSTELFDNACTILLENNNATMADTGGQLKTE